MLSILILVNTFLCKNIELDWTLDWISPSTTSSSSTIGNPDGLVSRPVIGVNNKWPIPPIYAVQGDLLVLRVTNLLNETSGLHFHGLFQKATTYYDGAGGVTDCGIAPNGGTLEYRVQLDQAGSFWVHGHKAGQYPDGLRTALIIHEHEKNQQGNHEESVEEFTLALSDWYHDVHAVNFLQFMSPDNPDGIEPIPNSVIVNDQHINTFSNIQPNKTYKLRLVSMATFAMINFYIQGGVNMTIVAVDAVDCVPYTTDFIQIATAQRYDVLVQFPATGFSYKAVAELDSSMFGVFLPDVFQPVANISFIAAGSDEKTPYWGEGQQLPEGKSFDEMVLQPLEREAALIPDSTTRYDVIFNLFSDELNHGTFNNSVFEFPNVPAVFTALSMGANSSRVEAYGPWAHSVVLKKDSVVEVVLVTHDKEGGHPFHLHGHTFQVIAKSYKADFTYSRLRDLAVLNSNPLRRDTVILPKFGWVALRFVADNPGVWLFHCHIQWHVEAGLAGQFIEAPDEMQKIIKVPADVQENCRKQGISMEGNAAGFFDLSTYDGLTPSPRHRISKQLVDN